MKKIRVLVLSGMYPRVTDTISGIFVHQQLKMLNKNNVEVKVVCPVPYSPRILWNNPRRRAFGKTPYQDTIDGIHVYYPRYFRPPGKWFYGISSYTIYKGIIKVVDSIINDFQPNILHTFAATPEGYTGILLKKKYKLPLVCSLVGSDIEIYPSYRPFTETFTLKLITGADHLIAVSKALKSEAYSMAKTQNEIQLVYMGCNYKKFGYIKDYRNSIRTKLNISNKDIIILYVGNLLKAKGIFELIEAFTYLNKLYGNLHLVFVGDGPAREELTNKIIRLHFDNKVHLIGSKLHEEIPQWMNASDILALPSYHEGLPNVVIEAMACQLPVVASNVGGIPEAVQQRKSGLLVKPRNVDSLVEALDFLIAHPEKAKEMGENARKIVIENFNWEQNAKNTIQTYRKTLAQIC